MAYSEIKKLKKDSEDSYKRNFCPYIVVGEDLFALSVYHFLQKKHGKNSVKFFCRMEDVNVKEFQLRGPSTFRGDKNLEAVQKMYPELEISQKTPGAVYLKEGNFRAFGGRGKSEKLLWGEKFYTRKAYSVELAKVFECLEDEEFFKDLDEQRLKVEIEKLDTHASTDLVEQNNWSLYCSNGELWQCTELMWGRSPFDFFKTFSNKNALSNEFIEFCESLKTPESLFVKLLFDKPVCDMSETLFIPLSYTHEWGHFIGEFEQEGEKQFVDFLTHIDADHSGEEDLSKKIRLIKKNIEKIFESSKNIFHQDFIQFQGNTPCQKIDDLLYVKIHNELKNLFFVGQNAPLKQFEDQDGLFEDSMFGASHVARALLNWREFTQHY